MDYKLFFKVTLVVDAPLRGDMSKIGAFDGLLDPEIPKISIAWFLAYLGAVGLNSIF